MWVVFVNSFLRGNYWQNTTLGVAFDLERASGKWSRFANLCSLMLWVGKAGLLVCRLKSMKPEWRGYTDDALKEENVPLCRFELIVAKWRRLGVPYFVTALAAAASSVWKRGLPRSRSFLVKKAESKLNSLWSLVPGLAPALWKEQFHFISFRIDLQLCFLRFHLLPQLDYPLGGWSPNWYPLADSAAFWTRWGLSSWW